MRLDQVILQLQALAGAEPNRQEALRIARSLGAELPRWRFELLRELRTEAGIVIRKLVERSGPDAQYIRGALEVLIQMTEGFESTAIGSETTSALNSAELVLQAAWCRETALPSAREAWNERTPALGQSDVTALVVEYLFGGELMRTAIDGFGPHFYNKLPDGRMIDLTRRQFPPATSILPGQGTCRRATLRSEKSVLEQTEDRYERLRKRCLQISVQQLRLRRPSDMPRGI